MTDDDIQIKIELFNISLKNKLKLQKNEDSFNYHNIDNIFNELNLYEKDNFNEFIFLFCEHNFELTTSLIKNDSYLNENETDETRKNFNLELMFLKEIVTIKLKKHDFNQNERDFDDLMFDILKQTAFGDKKNINCFNTISSNFCS